MTKTCRFGYDEACDMGALCLDCPTRDQVAPRTPLEIAIDTLHGAAQAAFIQALRSNDPRMHELRQLAAQTDVLAGTRTPGPAAGRLN